MAKGGLGFRGIGLVVLAAGSLFFGLRGIDRGDSGNSTAPSRTIKEFRLISSSTKLTKKYGPYGRSLPVPSLGYELEGPPAGFGQVRAQLVGEDGNRLDLMRDVLPLPMPKEATLSLPGEKPAPQPDTNTSYRFTLTGYPFAPRSPKLVLLMGDKIVYTASVPALPIALRTIPLVVPLEDEAMLHPLLNLKVPEGTWLTQYPYRWELSTSRPREWGTNLVVNNTEWPDGISTWFSLDGGKHGFGFSARNIGGFAEITSSERIVKAESREVTVPLEIFDDGSQAGLRILDQAAVEFSDGARFEFLAQERKIGRNRQGKLRSQVALPVAIGNGHAGMISSGWNYTYSLPDAPPPVPGIPPHTITNRLEFLSPTQEELGITRLEWGTDVREAKPEGPLRVGRFQVRVRVTHAVGFTTVRNRFIRIEPQS